MRFFSVYEESRGINDDEIIRKAFIENWILITSDKDFGEKIYRENRLHQGILLPRLAEQNSVNKIEMLK